MRAARIRRIGEALLEAGRVRVRLPSGGAPGLCIFAEYLPEAGTGELHLALGPGRVLSGDEVLPLDVVPAVHANFEARIAHAAHDVLAFEANIRPRQQRAVQE